MSEKTSNWPKFAKWARENRETLRILWQEFQDETGERVTFTDFAAFMWNETYHAKEDA